MRRIINNKLYDTEKAGKICTFTEYRKVRSSTAENNYITTLWFYELYETKKGQYFKYDQLEHKIELVTEEYAKSVVADADVNLYIKMFGVIEGG